MTAIAPTHQATYSGLELGPPYEDRRAGMIAVFRQLSEIRDYSANEGPMRIQYKMSGSLICIPTNETVQPPYFQNRIIMLSLPIPTLIYL